MLLSSKSQYHDGKDLNPDAYESKFTTESSMRKTVFHQMVQASTWKSQLVKKDPLD